MDQTNKIKEEKYMQEETYNIYDKYCRALEHIIPELKKDIKNNPEGKLQITAKDLAKKMGHEFETADPQLVYWGTKPCLFQEDIATSGFLPKKGEGYTISMRTRIPEDKLPISQQEI
jgi:hypothetical protein